MSVLGVALLCVLSAAPEAGVHGRSRTTVIVGSQPLYSVSRGALELRRFAPIIEELSLSAATGVEGLHVDVAAWTAIDAGDQFLGERAIADLTLAAVEWRTRHLTVRGGRMFLYSDTGRAAHLDGGSLAVNTDAGPLRFVLEAFGGVPVSTAYGEEPLREAHPAAATDPLFYAPKGSDWARPGDASFGVRGAASVLDVVTIGLGYAQDRDLDELDREAFIGRLHVAPIRALALDGFASFDLYGREVEDAELNLSYWLSPGLRAAIYGRARTPSLLLPSTSIFSVFAGEKHAEGGVEVDGFVWNSLRWSASAELRRAALEDGGDSTLGYRLTAGARQTLIFWPGARTALSYERLADPWFGRYDYLRCSLELPFSELLSLSPDAGLFLVERTGRELRLAGRLGLAAGVHVDERALFVVAGRATQDERGDRELALIVRIEWNVEHIF